VNSLLEKSCLALALSLALGLCPLAAQSSPSDPSAADPLADLNSADSDQLTGFAATYAHHLVVLEDGRFKRFDASSLKDVKYWAFYYSASWCAPCRAFTPKLIDFYNQFKPQHPNFELIFVNHDQTEDDMLAYMKSDAMTWPAVRFDDIDDLKANRYCGDGIPDLVLVDANGKILSDSFHGSDYLGPEKVMNDIKTLVPTP